MRLDPRRMVPAIPVIRHRVAVVAPPAAVWALLGTPRRWPEFDPFTARVYGAPAAAQPGQHLVALGRGVSVRVPVDVDEVDPESHLAITVHLAPGLRERWDWALIRQTRGGTQLRSEVTVEGPFARAAVGGLWMSTLLTARLLGRRAEHANRLRAATGQPRGVRPSG